MTPPEIFRFILPSLYPLQLIFVIVSNTEIADGSVIEKNPEFTHPLSSKTSTEYRPADRL